MLQTLRQDIQVIFARDPAARNPIDSCKRPPDERLAIRLYRHGIDRPVDCRSRIEAEINIPSTGGSHCQYRDLTARRPTKVLDIDGIGSSIAELDGTNCQGR